MKNFLKKLLCVLTCGIMLVAPVACGSSRSDNELEIRYYNGGFGQQWIEYAAQKFEDANPGVTVKLEADPELQSSIGTYLSSGKRLSDLYFTQSIDWQYFVNRGVVEPLDDLYETEVSKLDGSKIKIKDFMDDDRVETGRMSETYGAEAHYYTIPWSKLSCGMVYNENVVLNTPRRSTGKKWDHAPATMSELYEYVDDLNASDLTATDGDETVKVKPFAIGLQKGQWWLTFPLKVWWAQLQGVFEPTSVATSLGQGSYYDFWDFGAPTYSFGANNEKNVWNQIGIQCGLDILRSLLVDTETGKYTNTLDRCDEIEGTRAEQAFAKGQTAFIFVGNWIENEIAGFTTEGFSMKAMFVPTIDSSINERTGVNYVPEGFTVTDKINNNAEADLALIPAKAPNKELAKKFLAFINSEEMLLKFSEQTGCMRPFKYDPLDNEKDGFTYSEYAKSALALATEADYNIIEYPMNKGRTTGEERENFVSYIYTYKRPELFEGPGSGKCLGGITTKTGREIMAEVVEKTNVYYKQWYDELGLGDL